MKTRHKHFRPVMGRGRMDLIGLLGLVVALPLALGLVAGYGCGSEEDEAEEALDIQLTSKPATVETFKEAEFVLTLLEGGKPEGGHTVAVEVEETTDAHAPARDASMGGMTEAAHEGHMNAPEIAEGQHKIHMTFLKEGNYHMEVDTDHHGKAVTAKFDVEVEDIQKESAGHKVKFEIEPSMGMHSGDVHVGDSAEFEFIVTEASDASAVSDLAPVITFTSPKGTADTAADAENKGSGKYKAERGFASGDEGTWKVKFTATEHDETIEVEFEFPVAAAHEGRMAVMEMHSASSMGGMSMAGPRP